MGQIASDLRLLEAKNGLSSISIWQVGTRSLANIAGIMHSSFVKAPSARYSAPGDSLRKVHNIWVRCYEPCTTAWLAAAACLSKSSPCLRLLCVALPLHGILS